MITNIFITRLANNAWKAETVVSESFYDSIEIMAPLLVESGISDDEIDLALISLYAKNHTEAVFTDGKFVETI